MSGGRLVYLLCFVWCVFKVFRGFFFRFILGLRVFKEVLKIIEFSIIFCFFERELRFRESKGFSKVIDNYID